MYDSLTEKMEYLKLTDEEKNKFSNEQICIMYDKVKLLYSIHHLKEENGIKKEKINIVIILLNYILEELNKEKIDHIDEFKIQRPDLIQIDGASFVDDNLLLLDKIGLDKKKLKYSNRTKYKQYIIVILKIILSSINHELKMQHTTIKKKQITLYRIVLKKNENNIKK